MESKINAISQSTNLIRSVKGMYIQSIYSSGGTIETGGEGSFSGRGSFYLVAILPQGEVGFNRITVQIIPFKDNVSGCYGFDFKPKIDNKSFQDLGYNLKFLFDWENAKANSIFQYGQKLTPVNRGEDLRQTKEDKLKSTHETITTIDFLVFELSSNLWLYICLDGEEEYSLFYNMKITPDEFIKYRLYPEQGKVVQLLETL